MPEPDPTPTPSTGASRRGRNAEATRADLMEAARRRFAVHGYEHTTTRDIAGDVGVNVALVSRYFGSKDGLLEAILADPVPLLLDSCSDQPFVDALVDSLVSGMRPGFWDRYGGQHPAMLFARGGGTDERVRDLRANRFAAVVDRVLAAVDETRASAGDPSGRDDEEDPDDLRIRAEMVFALVLGTVLLREQLPRTALARAEADRLHDPFHDAVVALLGAGGPAAASDLGHA